MTRISTGLTRDAGYAGKEMDTAVYHRDAVARGRSCACRDVAWPVLCLGGELPTWI